MPISTTRRDLQQPWDAIIAGAGPAGACLSILLARAGWQTLLVDAVRFPRPKVCGECLSAAALPVLRQLGLEPRVREAAVVQRVLRIAVAGGSCLDLTLQGDSAESVLGISRSFLDALLVDQAKANGVYVWEEHRVRRVLIENGQVVGMELGRERHHPAPSLRVMGRTFIAADGRKSAIVRQTGRIQSRGPRVVGFKCHLRASPGTRPAGDTIEMVSFRGGYLGRCQVEHSEQNICGVLPRVAVRRARGSIRTALTSLCGVPESDDATSAAVKWLTVPDVRQQTATPTVPGVLYVGDACGTIEPLAGQGLAMAFQGAQLAAELLLNASYPSIDCRFQSRYATLWKQRFKATIHRASCLGWLLRHPGVLNSLARLAPVSQTLEELVLRACYRSTRMRRISGR